MMVLGLLVIITLVLYITSVESIKDITTGMHTSILTTGIKVEPDLVMTSQDTIITV